jgi:hypothetical protein
LGGCVDPRINRDFNLLFDLFLSLNDATAAIFSIFVGLQENLIKAVLEVFNESLQNREVFSYDALMNQIVPFWQQLRIRHETEIEDLKIWQLLDESFKLLLLVVFDITE